MPLGDLLICVGLWMIIFFIFNYWNVFLIRKKVKSNLGRSLNKREVVNISIGSGILGIWIVGVSLFNPPIWISLLGIVILVTLTNKISIDWKNKN